MEPAAREGLLGGAFVLQVALHADIAAEHDLAHGLFISGHFFHRVGVAYRDARLQVVAHALARGEQGAALVVQRTSVRPYTCVNSKPMSRILAMTAGAGAAPATMVRTVCVMPARISAGALASALCTMGAPQ
ncbi:hypothetical protein G6F35_017527 [Rhizopus arrhizus]|nr:hypothetical protein G6F35_017527 [Rhizopus arrhizus]